MPEVIESKDRGDTSEMPSEPSARPWLWWLFSVMVFSLVVLAAQQLAARIRFPWDMFIWAESPFLTNMLKLDHGKPIYGDPADANSFVYSPGLEYLTYVILKPFGRHLDIRYCRGVVVGLAVLASVIFAWCSRAIAEALTPESGNRGFIPVASGLFFLVIYYNFTSDIPHPDNLHILHSAVTLLLTLVAVRRESIRWAVGAILFAGVGVFAKQVACLTPIGVALALGLTLRKGLKPALALVGLSGMSALGFLTLLWMPKWSKFYTYDVLASHGVALERIPEIASFFLGPRIRLLPLLLLLPALGATLFARRGEARRMIVAYAVLAVFAVAPMFLAFLKPMGAWNNFGIIGAWVVVPVVPWLFSTLYELRGLDPCREGRFASWTIVVMAFAMVLALMPIKVKPSWQHYRFCWTVEKHIGMDLRAGKRVLVPHGMMFLLRNHETSIPLDRANSCLELEVAGKINRTGTKSRIESGYYDKIYLNCQPKPSWYGDETQAAMDRDYRFVETIWAPKELVWEQGFQYNLMRDTYVFESPASQARDRAAAAPLATAPSAKDAVAR